MTINARTIVSLLNQGPQGHQSNSYPTSTIILPRCLRELRVTRIMKLLMMPITNHYQAILGLKAILPQITTIRCRVRLPPSP